MKLTDFSYDLPEEKIAKYPPKERGQSKLMVIDRSTSEIKKRKYADMLEYFNSGDVLVINTTKVEKVRVFFLETKKHKYEIKIEKKMNDGIFLVTTGIGISEKIFDEEGEVPLPPYMVREAESEDYGRYNSVFAKESGSAAAPTASLNMTEDLLDQLKEKGVVIAEIQLNIGWGTFAPIRSEEIEDHKIHKEFIVVSKETAEIINKARENKQKIWALGTTVARTLESVTQENEDTGEITVRRFIGNTDIYIHRGYKWNIVDHLITNFHMPQSSLLVMISAFMGLSLTMESYNLALESDYKFLSYGDTMLIL